jgi:SAM-dependent methyltransferase
MAVCMDAGMLAHDSGSWCEPESIWNLELAPRREQQSELPAYYDGLLGEVYDDSWYGGLSPQELGFYSRLTEAGRCFELAVGTGRLAVPLLNSGRDLYGLDNSPQMLARLRAKLPQERQAARFVCWGALNTPYPCSPGLFDVAFVAFATFTLIHSNVRALPAENRVLREFNRLLKPGGIVVINDYRTGAFPMEWLQRPQIFNHELEHPEHGPILEEQTSTFELCPNSLIATQIIRHRRSRLIRRSDGRVLRDSTLVAPLWDTESFPLLGRDAGFDYVGNEIVAFHSDPTINHFFRKSRELSC